MLAAALAFFVAGMLLIFSGCSLSMGGAKFCFLDHADLTVTTHHGHADPNGP